MSSASISHHQLSRQSPGAPGANAKTCVILLGASKFPKGGRRIQDNPAFAASATAIMAYLTKQSGLNLSPDKILTLFDDPSLVDVLDKKIRDFLAIQTQAEDIILFYVGHGGFLNNREYYLALGGTEIDRPHITGLRMGDLSETLVPLTASKRLYLILDCCFSGEAVKSFQADQISSLVEAKIRESMPENGISILCAASKDDVAIAPEGSKLTMFSEAFLHVLENGISGSPPALTLMDIGTEVRRIIQARWGLKSVLPEVHPVRQKQGITAFVPLFPNPAALRESGRQLAGEPCIAHLGDLDFSQAKTAKRIPAWTEGMVEAMRRIGDDPNTHVRALVITGRPLVSPKTDCTGLLEFIQKIAAALRLGGSAHDWKRRVLLVDLEKQAGLADLAREPPGSASGGAFADQAGEIFATGIRSAAYGKTGRYYVPPAELLRVGQGAKEPERPRNGIKIAMFQRYPGFLQNASEVIRTLFEAEFDILLHSNEPHSRATAKLAYVEGGKNQELNILGCAKAADGFQLICFRRDGGVECDRFVRTNGRYSHAVSSTILSPHDRRRIEWERARRTLGWYDWYHVTKEMDAFGDVRQYQELTNIHPPDKGQLDSIPLSVSGAPGLGRCMLDRVATKPLGSEVVDLPPPGERIGTHVRLSPPARAGIAHPGFFAESTIYNSFAVSSLDAGWRGSPAPYQEDTFVKLSYPARRLTLVMHFPHGYAPAEAPKLAAIDVSRNDAEDQIETNRASQCLLYEQRLGIVTVDLPWTLPRFRYVLRWRLPVDKGSLSGAAIRAAEQVRTLLGLDDSAVATLDGKAKELRDKICSELLDCRPAHRDKLNLSVSIFDPDLNMTRVIFGTYDSSNSARQIKLRWGVGVCGLAMRRRNPAFVDTSEAGASAFYEPVEGCERELHLLCVPIPLPWDWSEREELLKDPRVPCTVATLASLVPENNMARLKLGEDRIQHSTLSQASTLIVRGVLEMLSEVGGTVKAGE